MQEIVITFKNGTSFRAAILGLNCNANKMVLFFADAPMKIVEMGQVECFSTGPKE